MVGTNEKKWVMFNVRKHKKYDTRIHVRIWQESMRKYNTREHVKVEIYSCSS